MLGTVDATPLRVDDADDNILEGDNFAVNGMYDMNVIPYCIGDFIVLDESMQTKEGNREEEQWVWNVPEESRRRMSQARTVP